MKLSKNEEEQLILGMQMQEEQVAFKANSVDTMVEIRYNDSFTKDEFKIIIKGNDGVWNSEFKENCLSLKRRGILIYRLYFNKIEEYYEVSKALVESELYEKADEKNEAQRIKYLIRGGFLNEDIDFPELKDVDQCR